MTLLVIVSTYERGLLKDVFAVPFHFSFFSFMLFFSWPYLGNDRAYGMVVINCLVIMYHGCILANVQSLGENLLHE